MPRRDQKQDATRNAEPNEKTQTTEKGLKVPLRKNGRESFFKVLRRSAQPDEK